MSIDFASPSSTRATLPEDALMMMSEAEQFILTLPEDDLALTVFEVKPEKSAFPDEMCKIMLSRSCEPGIVMLRFFSIWKKERFFDDLQYLT